MAGACKDAPPPPILAATRYGAPVAEDGDRVCADIGDKRVCWRGAHAELVPRALPAGAAPPDGFRCGGLGLARVCEDRARNGSAFACGATRCLQQRPRMPDDGEWECVEMSGVVLCHSHGALAGMQDGPMDLGWLCGARRGARDGERICVDLDPDRPEPSVHRRCRFDLDSGVAQRSCTPDPTPIVGDACSDAPTGARACPWGSQCEAGLCLPAQPEPACWLDGDCGDGARCVLGSCAKAGA